MIGHSYLKLFLVTLCIGAVAGSAGLPAMADDPPYLLPPTITGNCVWTELYEIGTGPERVAIVVWHDPVSDPPNGLYGQLQTSIDTYATDVAATGFTVTVVQFYGLAEDPDDPSAEDLRKRLKTMWLQPESLAGAVLVGNVPHLLYEYEVPNEDDVIFAADSLIGDLDATLTDSDDNDIFDGWSPIGGTEIWTSRIMARPQLVTYFNYEFEPDIAQSDILAAYFSRNHALRWSVFDSDGEALWFSTNGCAADCQGPLQSLFDTGVAGLTEICADPPYVPSATEYCAELPHGYAHIHLMGHGEATQHFGVTRNHYTREDLSGYESSADPPVMSYVFFSCYNCNFAHPSAAIGEVIVFNPEAPTLVGLGFTKAQGGDCTDDYYTILRAGGCLGEGLKATINTDVSYTIDHNGYVLLGDGTLKRWGNTVTWDGGAALDRWSYPENWPTDTPPGTTDSVLHNNADVIQMDAGSLQLPTQIVGFEGDGTLGGGLILWPNTALELEGNGVFSNGYDVTLPYDGPDREVELTILGGVFGGNFTLEDRCLLEVGGGYAAPRSQLYGTWLLDGANAQASIAEAEGSTAVPLVMTLMNGAQLGVPAHAERRAIVPPTRKRRLKATNSSTAKVRIRSRSVRRTCRPVRCTSGTTRASDRRMQRKR